MTVVVSGFEPFGGDATNPSWETAQLLAERAEELVGDRVVAVRLPVTFAGAQPVDVPVVPGAPVGHWSTLPLKASLVAAREAGVPVEVSGTAGTYVCNDVFYALMHHWGSVPGRRAGFVHVPDAGAVPVEDQVTAVAAVVRQALRGAPEPRVAAGTES